MSTRQRKILEKARRRRDKFLATVIPDVKNLSFKIVGYDFNTKIGVAVLCKDTGRRMAVSYPAPHRWKHPERLLPTAIDKLIQWSEKHACQHLSGQ